MELIRDPLEYQKRCERERLNGRSVALVPTMGALHEGHLALVDEASRNAGFVTASVFVNPSQFGPGEDFEKYPRDLETDMRKLEKRGVDAVFSPEVKMIYKEGDQTAVHVKKITSGLCGKYRPSHFEGVTTIVSRLFNLAGPCTAVFGRKDYQQLKVIQRMVRDLFFPVKVIGVHTVREPDGLAMSSRNRYLSEDERARASMIPAALKALRKEWNCGVRNIAGLNRKFSEMIAGAADSVDYAALFHAEQLYPLDHEQTVPGKTLAAAALRVGNARLIDNTVLGEPDPGLD